MANYGSDVQLYQDGKYRWVYELNMFKNPTIILTVAKVLGGVILGMYIFFALILYVFSGDWEGLWGMTKAMLIALGVLIALLIPAYLIVCLINGGKYVVLFEMDGQRITHTQLPRQFKRAQAVSLLAALAGAASGRPGLAGAGLLAASKQSSVSEYRLVKNIKPRRGRDLIKVNQSLEKNQIYVKPEYFDFVFNYISARCPQARIK